MIIASILWRRLDVPGHDACRLEQTSGGFKLDGAAVFVENGSIARLNYHITCAPNWETEQGYLDGWIGAQRVELRIVRANGWRINGVPVENLESLVDLDLGFTPATNLTQLRRIALTEGRSADVPVAWLDVARGTLSALPQRYERRSEAHYWYEAPSAGYKGILEVDSQGFIRQYPSLWKAEL